MDQNVRPVTRPPKPPKQLEYGINIVVNAVLLVIVNNVLTWGVLPWLAMDFKNVVWLFNVALIATITANIVFFFFNPEWFISLLKFFINIINLVLAIKLLQVFPFDFSAYAFNWALLIRIILIISIVGASIGVLAELLKFTVANKKRV